jgi:hypothetical protein
MPYPSNPWEGQPAPGTPFNKRREEMDSLRFVAIRNMAYIHYTNQPDPNQPPQPIMTYKETLDDRDTVKRAVLQFELVNGLIVPDGTEAAYFNATHQQPQGAPQMSQNYAPPPAPGYPPPPGAQQAPPQSYAPPPAPPQGYAPPPPPGAPPPPPQQAAPPPPPPQMAPPPQQMAPPPQAAPVGEPPAAPKGRKRAAPAGAAVAPPPPAPPVPGPSYAQPQAAMAPPPAPLQATPQQQWGPPPVAQPGYPAAPPAAAPLPAPNNPQHVPAAAPVAVDLGPVLKGIDSIGGGLSATSKDVEAMKGLLAEVRHLCLVNLAVQQVLFSQNTGLMAWAQGSGYDHSKGVAEFIRFFGNAVPR